jgi:hypothetical protein
MAETLRVLVYGSIDAGVCDSVRLGIYRDLLAEHDIELRTWGDFNDYAVQVPADYADRLDDAVRDGVATVDLSPINWADVVVFRRWYGTVYACDDCDYAAPDAATLADHCQTAGHAPIVRDRIIRDLLSSIERDRAVLRGRAMIYELDDDLLAPQPWLGSYHRIQGDLDLIERFARSADLVTVTTPVLAATMRRHNAAVRVIRNAVNPEWYGSVAPGSTPRPLSFLYYGTAPRLRDYGICRDVVDVTARATGARRIWLGSDAPEVRAVVDEALPYVAEVRTFARQLTAARPAIGLAPVGKDDFSRSHSELHWLEYSLAGAATVASRTMGGGPYDVIRDGVDGLLARNKAEWREALRRLASSPQMREDLAGRAMERVLAEYDVRQRAAEWADAFRWAADHAGRGTLRRLTRGLDRAEVQKRELAIESEARANLAHRRMVRIRSVEERETLARLRGDRDVCWPEGADDHPLVSVVIPASSRGRTLDERSLVSVLNQTYRNIEVVIVGDHATDEAHEAIRTVLDPRVRFEDLPERSPYPSDPEAAWMCVGSRPFNYGLGLVRGSWIVFPGDDGEFMPDHLETLLSVALDNRLELAYGDSWVETPDGPWFRLGQWPPQVGGFCAGAVLYSSALRYINMDGECWRDGETCDWNIWKRMIEAGVRAGHVDRIVFRHYLDAENGYLATSGAAAAPQPAACGDGPNGQHDLVSVRESRLGEGIDTTS